MGLVNGPVLTVNGLRDFLINMGLLINLLRCGLRVNCCGFVSWWTVRRSLSVFLDLSISGHRSGSANRSGGANVSWLSRIAIFTWVSNRANRPNRTDGARTTWVTWWTVFALGSNRAKGAYGSNWSRTTRVSGCTRFTLRSNWSRAAWVAGRSNRAGKTILAGFPLETRCA